MSLLIKAEEDDLKCHVERPSPDRKQSRKRRRVESEPEVTATESKIAEEDKKKLKLLKNPKLKYNNASLDEDTVADRLKPIGLDIYSIPMDQADASVPASRAFFAKYFGGPPQGTYCSSGKDFLVKHPEAKRRRDFMCLKMQWNPNGPLIPGAQGLFFGRGREDVWTADMSPLSVLIFLQSNQWLYLGEYKLGKSATLTTREWKAQKQLVKTTWTRPTATTKGGRPDRILIHLKKQLGREPTDAEFDAADADKDNQYKNVTAKDVEHEYDIGNYEIRIWTMKCVGYDEQIQRTVLDRYPAFEAEQKVKVENSASESDEDGPVPVKRGRKRATVKVTKEESVNELKSLKKKPTRKSSPGKKRSWSDRDSETESDGEDAEDYGPNIGGYNVRPSTRNPRPNAVRKRV
ncbi:hypothetical protein BDZ89DRAFT_1060383 [Hymenopellis radicata]|nr:hypothetical protein BDZ89DRAFT_1060383 [Hymenopellis radicata]